MFVLGVYGSAVHAEWRAPFGRVNALAVASEPYIFWRGENAEKLVQAIQLPPGAGTMRPAAAKFNGPSGRALDDDILKPIGFTRADAWLCNLVPHSGLNAGQEKAVARVYIPAMERLRLARPSVPYLPSSLADDKRVGEIVSEIEDSQAETIVMLGDKPLHWFLACVTNGKTPRSLEAFFRQAGYGEHLDLWLAGKHRSVLALAQTNKLGRPSLKWHDRHLEWKSRSARQPSDDR